MSDELTTRITRMKKLAGPDPGAVDRALAAVPPDRRLDLLRFADGDTTGPEFEDWLGATPAALAAVDALLRADREMPALLANLDREDRP